MNNTNNQTAEFDRAAHCRRIASKGGRATAQKYGREYMQQIGRKGFETTTKRYFQGEHHHIAWLTQTGLHNYWKSTQLPMKYTLDGLPVWPDEQPTHPAHKGYTHF